jgi:hypothetical protein
VHDGLVTNVERQREYYRTASDYIRKQIPASNHKFLHEK